LHAAQSASDFYLISLVFASNFWMGWTEGKVLKSLVVLMMEPEQPDSLSARKLVVETAKHNVLTAYNREDGLELLRRFPNVDVVLVHQHLISRDSTLLPEVKSIAPQVPLIIASPLGIRPTQEAKFVVDSHEPGALLQLLNEDLQT
jgi:hypothetical protein